MEDPAPCFAESHSTSPTENGFNCECRYKCECKFKCEHRDEETVGHSRSIVHPALQLDCRHPPSIYIDQQIFRLLLPALEETLLAADKWNALRIQKCLFNGIDRLAEILWNWNPRRSKTISSRVHAFDIPLFQQWLALRPPYPKSWLWTRDEAALCLQRYVRGWLVRKRDDVQELRQFWKDFAEKDLSTKQVEVHIDQQEVTSIEGGMIRDLDADRDKASKFDVNFVRCRAYRRMMAWSRTNHLKLRHSIVI